MWGKIKGKRKISLQVYRLVIFTLTFSFHTSLAAETRAELFEFWSRVAGAAGHVHLCGLRELDGLAAMKKVNEALYCQARDGQFPMREGKQMATRLLEVYQQVRDQNKVPSLQVCSASKELIERLLDTSSCM